MAAEAAVKRIYDFAERRRIKPNIQVRLHLFLSGINLSITQRNQSFIALHGSMAELFPLSSQKLGIQLTGTRSQNFQPSFDMKGKYGNQSVPVID